MRARHRLRKFLLRSGQRPPNGVRPWTRPYLVWVAQLRFTQIAQEATRQDYLHEVEHMRGRVARLEQAITEAVKLASPALQQIINDLQALRGIADISAVTIAREPIESVQRSARPHTHQHHTNSWQTAAVGEGFCFACGADLTSFPMLLFGLPEIDYGHFHANCGTRNDPMKPPSCAQRCIGSECAGEVWPLSSLMRASARESSRSRSRLISSMS